MKLISYKLYNNPKATWLDYIIAVISFGRYSHSELLFSNGLSLRILYGKQAELINRPYVDHSEWSSVNLYVSATEEEELLEYVKDNVVGKLYDTGGALLSIFNICTLQSDSKVFCSEAVADLLSKTITYSKLDRGCKYSPVSLHSSIIAINKHTHSKLYNY